MNLNKEIDFSAITQKTWTRKQVFKMFCGIMIAGICLYFFTLLIFGFKYWGGFLFGLGFSDDYFMDFFNPISYAASFDLSYTYWQQIYPPLPAVVCTFLAQFFPPELLNHLRAFGLRASGLGISMLIIFFLLSFAGILSLLYRLKEGTNKVKIIFCVLILFSYPLWFWFERANNISFALIGSLFFLAFYNSPKKFLKHLALFSLAVAINIKLYPAVFGMLLLREKRFKDILYLGLYTFALFFMPFLFVGQISDLKVFVVNLPHHTSWITTLCCGYAVSLTNVLETVFTAITTLQPTRFMLEMFFIISMTAGVLGAVVSYFIKGFWKTCALLSLLIVLIPQAGGDYGLLFMLIPLVLFLNGKEYNFRDLIYLFLFTFIFMLNIPAIAPIYTKPNGEFITINNLFAKLSCTVMFIMLCYDGIKDFLNAKRKEYELK